MTMTNWLCTGGIIFPLLFGVLSAEANSGHYGGRGGAVFPLQSTEVQMVRERVEMESTGFSMHWGPKSWRVRCTFLFKNTTKNALNVPMGFPVQSGMHPSGQKDKGGPPKSGSLTELRLWVDGEGMETSVAPDGSGTYKEGLHTWSVPFAAKQQREVVVTYLLSGSSMNTGFQYLLYILKTGATWKGVIKEAELVVRFNERVTLPPKENRLNLPCKKGGTEECLLKGMKMQGGDAPDSPSVWTWRFKNLKPEHDFFLVYSTAAYERFFLRQNLLEDEWAEANAMSPEERKDLMWALIGKPMTGHTIESFVHKQDWYFIDPNFDEKKVLERLEPVERAYLLGE